MKNIISIALLIGSFSSFAACPDLTGEYAKCKSDVLGAGLQSVEIISVVQNGKYTIDTITDGQEGGEMTEGMNTVFNTTVEVKCVNNAVIIDFHNRESEVEQTMGLSLNVVGDLVHSLYYDVGTEGEGKVDYTCSRI
jgi:hypothetical protein